MQTPITFDINEAALLIALTQQITKPLHSESHSRDLLLQSIRSYLQDLDSDSETLLIPEHRTLLQKLDAYFAPAGFFNLLSPEDLSQIAQYTKDDLGFESGALVLWTKESGIIFGNPKYVAKITLPTGSGPGIIHFDEPEGSVTYEINNISDIAYLELD